MNKILQRTLAFLLVVQSECQTPVKKCPGEYNRPTYVNVVGCTRLPCRIATKTTLVMYMNFTSPEDIDSLQAKVNAKALGINVVYPLPKPDACKELTNTHCPLEINEPAQYKLEMPIYSYFPQVALVLTLYLEANGIVENRAVCFMMDAVVVKTS